MLIKMNRIFFLMFAAIAFSISAKELASPILGQVVPEGLSHAQAEQVLTVVLKHLKIKPYYQFKSHWRFKSERAYLFIDGDFADENGNQPHPGYFDFAVGYEYPEALMTDYEGRFSVNILTGDVWEIYLCKRYAFPALRRIQKSIMKQTGKTMASEKARRKELGCTGKN
jgi:hypothetical protein